MSILDRIKGNKEEGKVVKAKKPKKASKKTEDVLNMVQEPESVQAPSEKLESEKAVLKGDTGRAHHILHNYHLSEKSNIMSTNGRYTFRVSKFTNKLEIKKAIEKVYEVHVTAVNIVMAKGKKRRSGRTTGKTSDWKKAYVTLKDGEKISGLSEGI